MSYKRLIPCIFIYKGKAIKWFDVIHTVVAVVFVKQTVVIAKLLFQLGTIAVEGSFILRIGGKAHHGIKADIRCRHGIFMECLFTAAAQQQRTQQNA